MICISSYYVFLSVSMIIWFQIELKCVNVYAVMNYLIKVFDEFIFNVMIAL